MCDQYNLKTNMLETSNFKGLMCDQNNLKDKSVTNLRLKGPLM